MATTSKKKIPEGAATYLVKSEPSVYPFSRLVEEGRTAWDGVRNYEARNNLRAMKKGDLCLYYHSNEGKEIVGVARVVALAYPDPTAEGEDWSAVDLEPAFALDHPVSLATIRATPELAGIHLLAKPRISVVQVSRSHFDVLLRMAAGAPRKRA